MTCLKYLLPISCVLLLGVGFWEVLARPWVGSWFAWVLSGVSVVLLLWLGYKVITTPSEMPMAGVTPPWVKPQNTLTSRP
jgi:hypothetical protein